MRHLISIVVLASSVAHAAPPEPNGAHPRMLLDAELRGQWKAMAKLSAGPVVGAIRLCEDARTTNDHDRAQYQGSEWARMLQACLVAWAATDRNEDAATAIRFFTALLDDRDTIGDGLGGDTAARRDSGYALRNLGPYTALAYDWLYNHPLMTPELKERARQRWKAWLAWYRDKGYRATNPGSNYHAGYLIAATTIAIAQAGDAAADGTALWQHVADQMWNREMAAALAEEGVLAGGNWPEGWQYGPLSVAEYSLAARVVKRAGVDVPGIETWLSSLLRHHVYALSPSDAMYATGDSEDSDSANLPPNVLTLDAVALGDASAQDKRWARGELARLKLTDRNYFLYNALATVGEKPTLPPRSVWPTWYLSANTGTLYARTRWDDTAIWFVSECHATIDTDHRHPSAGTFALSRGRDDVIVDPSPYGSASTLTSNAPTVASAQLPADYIPSQGSWSVKTGYDFVTQRASGVVAARCDYSDQYKFQDRPSDVPDAFRDFVLLPSTDGRDAALLVIDRATTGSDDRGMNLRFRTPGKLALAGDVGTATVGSTKLAITSVTRSAPGTTEIGVPTDGKDCYREGIAKGRCNAARVPVTDYRVLIPGPAPVGVHVISVTGDKGRPATATPLSGKGWAGVHIVGLRDATVVWRTRGSGALDYSGPPGTHVILDGPDVNANVTAQRDAKGCAVHVTGGGTLPARPLVIAVDAECRVKLDPEAPAASALGTRARGTKIPGGMSDARSPRSGCCGAEATPGSAFAMALVVLAILFRRRKGV
ncbi:MAG TPA: hypothetical protein VFV99_24375 [Kofleriaceae bacterium]|nr:hypothetical protein [Kofleriaceae bacterium]